MSIAFKEWAIICEALGAGVQSIILRKGGIHEGREGFSFNLKSEVDRGELAQSAGRECHSSDFAVSIDTPQSSSCHRVSASCASSSPPTSEIRFKHGEFYLFPTLFHEQIARTRLPAGTRIPAGREGEIGIGQWARVEWTATITELERAMGIGGYHVWNEEVVRERFEYDEAPGLHLAFLRVYRCEPGWGFPDEGRYGGCRSWVNIPDGPEGMELVPTVGDEEHARRSGELRAALGLEG